MVKWVASGLAIDVARPEVGDQKSDVSRIPFAPFLGGRSGYSSRPFIRGPYGVAVAVAVAVGVTVGVGVTSPGEEPLPSLASFL